MNYKKNPCGVLALVANLLSNTRDNRVKELSSEIAREANRARLLNDHLNPVSQVYISVENNWEWLEKLNLINKDSYNIVKELVEKGYIQWTNCAHHFPEPLRSLIREERLKVIVVPNNAEIDNPTFYEREGYEGTEDLKKIINFHIPKIKETSGVLPRKNRERIEELLKELKGHIWRRNNENSLS